MRRIMLSFTAILLLNACGTDEQFEDSFTFTQEDAERVTEILDRIEGEYPNETNGGTGFSLTSQQGTVVINAADAHRFDNIRSAMGSLEENTYRVTNVFVNVREAPVVQSKLVTELVRGDQVRVLSFPNARWAEVRLADGRTGFISSQYIARIVSERQLADLQKQYEGQYVVNFAFLNVRSEPSVQGLKLGELPGQAMIKPIAIEGEWARIPFEDGEGFVSTEYLQPYTPKVLVRQETFHLPILRYRGDDPEVAAVLVQHIALLREAGKKIITLRDFYDDLLMQEENAERIPDDRVLLLITDVAGSTLSDLVDALRASDVRATFCIEAGDIGAEGGPTPQAIAALSQNGQDVQSGGYGGEDLRALTNTQVLQDLAQSRQILEELTEQEVFAVAYPAGGTNERVVAQAIQAGYLFGVTLTPAVGESIERSAFLQLPSTLVTPATTEQTFKSLLKL